MVVREQHQTTRRRRGRISATLVSIACCLRRLPLFFSTTPKTPLRVLCIIAFDTLHVLRTSKPLSRHRVRALAALLDFGACANAALDNKVFSSTEGQATRQRLQDAGVGPLADEYLRQLRKLERRRPSAGGDHRQYEDVRSYREAVARLSLGIVAAMALGDACSENGTRSTFFDDELKALFRIVMQCQIIDDVLDYARDLSTGLPSFLTGTASLPQALELTAEAVRNYADGRDLRQSADLFPLRVALVVVSAIAKLVIRIRYCQHRMRRAGQLRESHTKQIQVLFPAVQRTGTSR